MKTPEIDLREDYSRNYIINGNFDFWQRDTTFVSPASGVYTCDRFLQQQTSGTGTITINQSTDVPNLDSEFSYHWDVTSADASLASSALYAIQYRMEGLDLRSIVDKQITLSFYVKSDKVGIYSVSFVNDNGTRSYVSEYTIDQANVWERKEIKLIHDSTGTWNYDNSRGIRIRWCLASGGDVSTSNLDQWESGGSQSSTNQVNLMDNSSNNFRLSQVQLTEGSETLPFRRAGKSYAEELSLCRRYLYRPGFDTANSSQFWQFQAINTSNAQGGVVLPVPMRSLPTVTFGSLLLTNSVSASAGGVTNIVADNITNETMRLAITIGAPFGLAAGNATILQRSGGTGFIQFDAEL